MSSNGHENMDKAIRAWADLEWLWVLTTPITRHRDSILTIEMEGELAGVQKRFVPVFENREAALAIKPRLCQGREADYAEQAMRLGDIGKFAAKEQLEIVLLDEEGRIMARFEAKMEEEAPLH